jgi:hypothetical protein
MEGSLQVREFPNQFANALARAAADAAGSLLVSQLLTLFTTPVVYLYLDELSRVRWRLPASGGVGPPQSSSVG